MTYDFNSEEIKSSVYINASQFVVGKTVGSLALITYPSNQFNVLGPINLKAGTTLTATGGGGGNARFMFAYEADTLTLVYISAANARHNASNPLVFTPEKDVVVYIQPQNLESTYPFTATFKQVVDTTPTVNGYKITDNPTIEPIVQEIYTSADYETASCFFPDKYYSLRSLSVGSALPASRSVHSPIGEWGSYEVTLGKGETITVTNVGGSNAKGFYVVSTATGLITKLVETTGASSTVTYTATENCLVGGGIYVKNYLSLLDIKITRNLTEAVKSVSEIQATTDTLTDKINSISGCKFLNPKPNFNKEELRILDIGNSFTEDCTNYGLKDLVTALGVDTSKMAHCVAMRGGASYKNWYDVYYGNDTSGNVYKNFGGLDVTLGGSTAQEKFRTALTQNKWDIIVIHQVSSYSHDYTTWEGTTGAGYLKEFIRLLRFHQPQACIAFLMVHGSYSNDSDTLRRWQGISDSARYMQTAYGMDLVIPNGTAIQNLRASKIAKDAQYGLCGDKHHLAYGIPRYTAALTYYEALLAPYFKKTAYGSDVITIFNKTSTYDYIPVSKFNAQTCQMAAMLAVTDMYTINNPDGLYVGDAPEYGSYEELTLDTTNVEAGYWMCDPKQITDQITLSTDKCKAANATNQTFVRIPAIPNKSVVTVDSGYYYRVNYYNSTTGTTYRGGITNGNGQQTELVINGDYDTILLNFIKDGDADSTLLTDEYITELLTHIKVEVPA